MDITPEFREKLLSVIAKRPATIIQHILKHGSITSEEIKSLYGYNHPLRVVRDVREFGIPIETFRIKDSEGRNIAAYRFGDLTKESSAVSKKAGRTALSKALKKALIDEFGSKCFVYQEELDQTLLQVDHRIPYEIGGEQGSDTRFYMLLLQIVQNHGLVNLVQIGILKIPLSAKTVFGHIRRDILILQVMQKEE